MHVQNGWTVLTLLLFVYLVDIGLVVFRAVRGPGAVVFALTIAVASFLMIGFFSL